MRWALVCCLVLGGIHAYLGYHVVRRGILFVDLTMAQMAALGAAVAIVLGIEHDTFGEYAISLGFALGAAALFAVVRSRRVSHETLIAIFYGMAMAALFVVLEHSPHGMEEVKHLFVGQVLTVAPRRVVATGVLYIVIGLVHWKLHHQTKAVTEGREPPRRIALDLFFYGSFALVVTHSVALVGVLLVFAFLVLPAVSAMLLSSGGSASLAWGWFIAAVASVAGLHVGFVLDLPAAPVIALTLGVALGAAAIAGRQRVGSNGGERS